MRFDVEIPLAQLFVAYFNQECAVQTGGILDVALCPIVTFYDPMSVDEADRVIVMVPTAESAAEDTGHFGAMVEVYQKTRWAQKTLQQDSITHFGRLNELRDKLFSDSIVTLMAPLFPNGMKLDWVNRHMQFGTKIVGDSGGFFTSSAIFDVAGVFTQGT